MGRSVRSVFLSDFESSMFERIDHIGYALYRYKDVDSVHELTLYECDEAGFKYYFILEGFDWLTGKEIYKIETVFNNVSGLADFVELIINTRDELKKRGE